MNNVAIFTTNIANYIDLIDRIKNFFTNQNMADDFVIFTDEVFYSSSSHGVLTRFYMIAYRGLLVFLDLNDYLNMRDQIPNQCVIYIMPEQMQNLDRSMLKNCSFLTESDNRMVWVKNHELS